jgi:hypothetical protein
LFVQCCLIAALVGAGACGGNDDDDDDDGVTEEEHAHASACDDEDHHSDEGAADGGETLVGIPSGATCPSGNELTYDNFGKQFMSDFCVRCHSSELTDCEDRNGAPFEHDFDTLPGILLVADHIDQMAASGPDHTNETMPPDGDKPTLEQREQLGQWLACEIEKVNE